MEIREYSIYDETEILRLYQSVGWTAYTDHPEVLRKGFENSMLILAAYEGDQLCGVIRTVGDGHTVVLFRIFWCCRSISGKASAPHFCKLSWIGTAVYVKLSWQRIIHRKPLLFTGLWVSVKCQRSAAVDL